MDSDFVFQICQTQILIQICHMIVMRNLPIYAICRLPQAFTGIFFRC